MADQNDNELKRFSARLAVGRMAYDTGYFSQAARHFQLALNAVEELNLPKELEARALIGLAKSTAATGNFNKAESLLQKALSIDCSDYESTVEEAEDYHQLSLLYWRSGRADQSLQVAKKAWSLANQDDCSPDELKAKLLKHLAVLAEQAGRLDE